MEITVSSTQDTEELAQEIATKLKPRNVLALYGDLGSGKTTFTSYLVKALNINSRVQSPTFILARRYVNDSNENIKIVHHLDLYRLTSEAEADEFNISDFTNEAHAITVIEWPELVEKSLPIDTIKIRFDIIEEHERKISVQNLY